MYGKIVHRKVTGSLETCENWAYTTCAASSDSDENAVEEDDNEIVPITKTGRDKVDFEHLETQDIAASPPSKKRVLCATQQFATFKNISASFPRAPQFPCMSEKSLQESTSDIPYSACLNGILAASTATAPQRNVVFPIDQGKFLRKVLYKLEQLSEAVKSLNDRVDTRLGRVIDADESMFSLKENINNMDDFNENESQLAEEPMKRKLYVGLFAYDKFQHGWTERRKEKF